MYAILLFSEYIKEISMTKVIKLSSMVKYTHSGALAVALSDEDFKTPFNKLLINALREEDVHKRFLSFSILQHALPMEHLEKVALNLDYYGYMYDYTDKKAPIFSSRLNERVRTHEEETPMPSVCKECRRKEEIYRRSCLEYARLDR